MPQWPKSIKFAKKSKNYYCEIPWEQIWEEFHQWLDNLEVKVGKESHLYPTWEKQQKKFQQIANATISYRLRWKNEIWGKFLAWWFDCFKKENDQLPEWEDQKIKIQQLVQEEADFSVNR